jgi:hypothetical protein
MPPRRRSRGVLALFEGGVQKPVLLAHVVPVEDADLTTAGGRLLSVLAVAAVDHAGRADELNCALVATKRSLS